MRICDYSSLIFAGNTTVLLIVSLTTDYWEYRQFNTTMLIRTVHKLPLVNLVQPLDTDSYIQITMAPNGSCDMQPGQEQTLPKQPERFYHAPVFMIRRSVCVTSSRDVNVTVGNGTITEMLVLQEHELNLFKQYGNLFRDCDDLEMTVRERLGLDNMRPGKCVYYHTNHALSSVHRHSPALTHLESMASACALLCIICICSGLVTGSHGLFLRYRRERAFNIASCSSLIAGFFLTAAIALFHGKCYLLRKMEFFPGQDVPFKYLLEGSRLYSYGWSFILAWLCVLFCYVSSYVWLSKAQGPSRRGISSTQSTTMKYTKIQGRVSWRERMTRKLDNATV